MGGLIVPEYKLRDIISQMPSIDYGGDIGVYDIQFGWGSKKSLNKYLDKKGDDSYPLIWLLNPSKKTYKDQSSLVERDCSLIIATLETRKDMDDEERFDAAFKIVLNPIADLIIQGVRSANTTMFLNDNKQDVFDFPDYSDESSGSTSGTIALWDAIRLDCRIEFNNSCLNDIKWMTN